MDRNIIFDEFLKDDYFQFKCAAVSYTTTSPKLMYNPSHAIGVDFHFLYCRDYRCQPVCPVCKHLAWHWACHLVFAFYSISPSRIFKQSRLSSSSPAFITFISSSLFSFFFGAWWYQFRQPNIDAFHVAFYNDRDYEMLVTGTLAEPPDYRDTYTNLQLKVEAVDSGSGDMPAQGLLLVRVPALVTYEYGQRVRVRGNLKTPPENEEFSYRDYLARQNIHSYMSIAEVTVLPGNDGNPFFAQVYKLKEKLLENTYRLYHDPEASLLAGILLGVDTGLTRELQDAFKNTGTAHIIAISGFNIAIIAGHFLCPFSKIFLAKGLAQPLPSSALSFILFSSARMRLWCAPHSWEALHCWRVNWAGATTA